MRIPFDAKAIEMFPELSDPDLQDQILQRSRDDALAAMAFEASMLERIVDACPVLGCAAALSILDAFEAAGATLPGIAALMRVNIERLAPFGDIEPKHSRARSTPEFALLFAEASAASAELDRLLVAYRSKLQGIIASIAIPPNQTVQ
jgi:hypothetical protein